MLEVVGQDIPGCQQCLITKIYDVHLVSGLGPKSQLRGLATWQEYAYVDSFLQELWTVTLTYFPRQTHLVQPLSLIATEKIVSLSSSQRVSEVHA